MHWLVGQLPEEYAQALQYYQTYQSFQEVAAAWSEDMPLEDTPNSDYPDPTSDEIAQDIREGGDPDQIDMLDDWLDSTEDEITVPIDDFNLEALDDVSDPE